MHERNTACASRRPTAQQCMHMVDFPIKHKLINHSQLAPIGETSNICTKLISSQVECLTHVDSYSLQLEQFEEKTNKNVCCRTLAIYSTKIVPAVVLKTWPNN